MQRTRNHARFHHWYNFDSYEKGWVTTGRYGQMLHRPVVFTGKPALPAAVTAACPAQSKLPSRTEIWLPERALPYRTVVPCRAVLSCGCCRPDGDSDAAAAVSVPSGPWRLLGVDCEMCATAENDKELLQVAVVDEQDTLLMQVSVGPAARV